MSEQTEDLTPSESEDAPPIRRASLSERWRRRAIRYGSKVEGEIAKDPEKLHDAAQDKRGDPYGPNGVVALVQGFLTGGKRPTWDINAVRELDENGRIPEPKGEPFNEGKPYERDDPEVLWKLFRIRIND